MAKKKTTTTTTTTTTTKKKSSGITKQTILRSLAYIGLVVSALLFLLSGILKLCNLDSVVGVLNQIASLCLLIAVAWPAWDFCRGKAKWIKYLWIIAIVLYILGMIFGFLKL